MEKEVYERFMSAKNSRNIVELKKLYGENPDNLTIKFEYAKTLERIDIDLARKLLKELIGTPNETYALLELASIARGNGNSFLAKAYLNEILHSSRASEKDRNIAWVELGKLEKSMGNRDGARICFNSATGVDALLELGKLDVEDRNLSKAEKLFVMCLGSYRDLRAKLWLGRVEALRGHFANALIYFEELKSSKLGDIAKGEIDRVHDAQMAESNKIRKRVPGDDNNGR